MSFVITDVENLSPEWLSDVLRKNGLLESGQVLGIRPLLTKTLQVSKVIRLAVDYSRDASATAPETLFLKLSKPNSSITNRSEIAFYTGVGHLASGRLVRCYDAAFSEETNSSHLIMEDLFKTHAQPSDGKLP